MAKDKSSVCKTFCSFTEQDKITFWLGSEEVASVIMLIWLTIDYC